MVDPEPFWGIHRWEYTLDGCQSIAGNHVNTHIHTFIHNSGNFEVPIQLHACFSRLVEIRELVGTQRET